jgi:hypothetical protein
VEDGVLSEIDENGQTVALATTQYDEVCIQLTGDPDDFGFHVAGFYPA